MWSCVSKVCRYRAALLKLLSRRPAVLPQAASQRSESARRYYTVVVFFAPSMPSFGVRRTERAKYIVLLLGL